MSCHTCSFGAIPSHPGLPTNRATPTLPFAMQAAAMLVEVESQVREADPVLRWARSKERAEAAAAAAAAVPEVATVY